MMQFAEWSSLGKSQIFIICNIVEFIHSGQVEDNYELSCLSYVLSSEIVRDFI